MFSLSLCSATCLLCLPLCARLADAPTNGTRGRHKVSTEAFTDLLIEQLFSLVLCSVSLEKRQRSVPWWPQSWLQACTVYLLFFLMVKKKVQCNHTVESNQVIWFTLSIAFSRKSHMKLKRLKTPSSMDHASCTERADVEMCCGIRLVPRQPMSMPVLFWINQTNACFLNKLP